mgnify:CR=1 FL=1
MKLFYNKLIFMSIFLLMGAYMDAKQPIVVIETNQGAIDVELFPSAAK